MNSAKKVIEVPYPLNMAEKDRFRYEPYLRYELLPQKVKNFRNVFVGNSGFCMNNRGLIKECHHAYPAQHHYYLNEASRYYYAAADRPENLVILDDDNTYLAIHHPWFNYYHWVCESLFRLWKVRRRLDDLVLLLPDHYGHADFITGSLEPFNIKHIYHIPAGKSLMVRNLCLPQIKPLCDSYDARELKQLRDFYVNYVLNEKKIDTSLGDRIYVSRRMAPRRKVVNGDEIERVFEKFGFSIFCPEQYSFLEQISIFSGVKFLVGEQGSGLTNLLFMDKNTSVLELHKDKTNELDHPSPLFWYMAQAIGAKYYHQLCDGGEDYFEGDFIVDAALLEKNLALMCGR
ncbi:MAG: glycosyltransferase family 61 protein [Mucilaginibacter sp.]